MMRDTPEFAAAWLGAVRAGAVAVARQQQAARRATCATSRATAGAKLALLEDAFAAAARGARPAALRWSARTRGAGSLRELARDRTVRCQRRLARAACCTRRARPAARKASCTATAASSASARRSATFGIGEGDVIFTTSKFFFAYGIEHGLLAPLARRRNVDPVRRLAGRRRGGSTSSRAIDRRRCSACRRSIAGCSPRRRSASPAFAAVRRFVAGGRAPVARSSSAQWKQGGRRRDPEPLRHVGDLLRLHGDAAGDLRRPAHRQAAAGRRSAAARRAGRRTGRGRAGRAVGAASRPRPPATPTSRSRRASSSATAGSAAATSSCATPRATTSTRAAPTS